MTHPVLDEITSYCAVAGIAESTFGNRALKDSRFVADLREGKVTLRRIETVRAWMAANPAVPVEAPTAKDDAA